MSKPPPIPAELEPVSQVVLRERDRLAMLLEVARASASLDLSELIQRVGTSLQQSQWRWDHTSLCLHDPVQNALRAHSFFFAPGPLVGTQQRFDGGLIPIEGTQSGRVFLSGEACVVNTRTEYDALMSPAWAARVVHLLPPEYSACIVPLVARGKRIGTFACATARDGAFGGDAVELLSQMAEVLAPAVENALVHRQLAELQDRLAREKRYLESEVDAAFDEVVGRSPALRRVVALVESVAATNSGVLICGETGTGKELIARAIHRLSGRRSATFVKLNCAAIPTGLLESELFGHEKGAFTGAVSSRAGRFELAHTGTLFLDEVGEIPLDVQPKLLRVLQDQEFERLGGTKTIKVDARVVAATNRDLAEMTAARTFRRDLFYRLNVFPIVVPPLRERREDILALARHFMARVARRLRKEVTGISSDSLEALCRYDWPGNVRELANVVERAVIVSTGSELHISLRDLETIGTPPAAGAGTQGPAHPAADAAPITLVDAERALIRKTLDETGWVVGGRRGAAQRLGLSRTTLQGRMRKLGIARPA